MKVAILTSGGDAPGMNACVLQFIDYARKNNLEPYVVTQGFKGLVYNQIFTPECLNINWDYASIPGSIIKSARFPNFKDEYKKAIKNLKEHQIEYLVVVGGNGSFLGAKLLSGNGIKTIFIPSTIDNDVDFTEKTIGFSSCCQEVVNTSLKIKQTFKTHNNICLIEIMGRYCSDITIASSLVIKPSLCLTHENKMSVNEITEIIKQRYQKDEYAIITLTEHLYSIEEKQEILKSLAQTCHCDTRLDVLGYVQRGASPDWNDIYLANLMAVNAVLDIINNKVNQAIVLKNGQVTSLQYNELSKVEKLGEKELSLIND